MKYILSGLLFAPMLAQLAYAEDSTEDTFTWSGRISADTEHHSNVSVSEIESTTGEADSAFFFTAGLDSSWAISNRVTLDAGYNYSDRRFTEFSEFDLQIHLGYVDLSYEINQYTIGANLYYADAAVARSGFLTLNQQSLYAARFFGSRVYGRAAFNQARKSFREFPARSASNQGLSGDLFWFSSDLNRFLSLGVTYLDEDANNREFSYQSLASRIRLSQRFEMLGRNARLQLSARWEERDYEAAHTLISQPREDTQLVAEANFELNIIRALHLTSEIERGRYRSNLAIADYAETRAGVGLRLNF